MKRILFFLMCISLIPNAFADVNTPNKNAKLIQAAKDTDANTESIALNKAAYEGNFEEVKALIAKGADVNAKNEKGNTPLSLAKAANNKTLIELLEKYNATGTSGMQPAEQIKQQTAAQTSDLPLDIDCGILYCGWDEKTDVLDIFIADSKLHTKINLTRGRLTTKGWSQPWEPVGSPDGKTVVLRQFKRLDDGKRIETRIWLLDIKEQNLQQVPGKFGFVVGFAWSPDSSSFAFSKENEIIVCDKKTLNLKTVATGGNMPLWSPDSRWLAFIQKDGDTRTLQLVSLQNGEKKSVTSGLDTDNVCWCLDSQKLAIVKNGQLSIALLNGEIQNLNYQASDVSSWSHNGKYIAFETRLPTKKRCLWILSLADKKTSKVDISGDNSSGVWGPESDLLAFWNMMGSDLTLMAVGPDGKNPQRVDSPHFQSYMRPSWLFVRQAKQGSNGSQPATGQTEQKEKEDKFPLHKAAYEGNLEKVKALIAKGADVNVKRTDDGVTALIMASQNGHMEVISCLIRALR